jgi:hypothetical protein
VILHAPKACFLRAAFRKTYGRMSKLYPDLEGSSLTGDFRRFETAVQRLEESRARDLFSKDAGVDVFARQVVDDPAGAYVWSDVGRGITANPEEELEKLFARYVTRYDASQPTRRSDADVWKPARDLLAERQLASLFQPKVIRSSRDEVEFEHAWKNGVWHCVQPLSFDLSDEESIRQKAARWVGHMAGLQKAEEAFVPYFIVGKPSQPGLRAAYQRAVDFLGEAPSATPPKVVTEEQVHSFVDQIEGEMAEHVKEQEAGISR